MWLFYQSNGNLLQNINFVSRGYSGFGTGKNNPNMQHIKDIGPIPRGIYVIGSPFDDDKHGPFCLYLNPSSFNEMFGRSGFLMHGDNIEHPGTASHGCTIFNRDVREKVANSGDKYLVVV